MSYRLPSRSLNRGFSIAKLIVYLVLIGALGAGLYTFIQSRSEKPPEFMTAQISRGNITQVVTATGQLAPVVQVDVSSQVSGIVQEITVDFNSPVQQAQVLLKLDPATYEARVRQAEAELNNAEANLELVEMNTERIQSLRGRELVSQSELDQALANLRQAQTTVLTRTSQLESAKVDLSRCTIYSPIDGIVISREAEVGKTVAASLSAPTLFVIANDLTQMQITAAVSEADIGAVAEGQDVRFTVDAYPSRPFRGRVSQIRNSPKTVENVVTYQTIIDVRNPDLKLKPGMTANVSIVVAERENVLRISNAALRVRLPENLTPATPPPAAQPAGSGPAVRTARAETTSAPGAAGETAAGSPRQRRGGGGGPPPGMEGLSREERMARFRQMRDGGGAGSDGSAVSVRNVYRLESNDPTAPLEAVSARLGITDGVYTEVLAGLEENQTVITGMALSSAARGSSAPARNPFSGGRGGSMGRRF